MDDIISVMSFCVVEKRLSQTTSTAQVENHHSNPVEPIPSLMEMNRTNMVNNRRQIRMIESSNATRMPVARTTRSQ